MTERPWSTKRPQSFVLSLVLIGLAVALVWQAFAYISQGIGGAIPYFLMIGGPVMAGYYVWYFNFQKFDEESPS